MSSSCWIFYTCRKLGRWADSCWLISEMFSFMPEQLDRRKNTHHYIIINSKMVRDSLNIRHIWKRARTSGFWKESRKSESSGKQPAYYTPLEKSQNIKDIFKTARTSETSGKLLEHQRHLENSHATTIIWKTTKPPEISGKQADHQRCLENNKTIRNILETAKPPKNLENIQITPK